MRLDDTLITCTAQPPSLHMTAQHSEFEWPENVFNKNVTIYNVTEHSEIMLY